MSDTIASLDMVSSPITIKYVKNRIGFSNPDNNNNKYLFDLVINGNNIGNKYFRNIEDYKYSYLINVDNKIKLNDIDSYKVSVAVIDFTDTTLENIEQFFEIKGQINKNESCSTKRLNNLYIEFTQNEYGYALCSCFYTGLDHNNIFASPPN